MKRWLSCKSLRIWAMARRVYPLTVIDLTHQPASGAPTRGRTGGSSRREEVSGRNGCV